MKLAVGTDKTILNVHQKILCTSSKFFQNASKPEWASSRSAPDTIDLTDESLGIVKSYVRWLYLGVLPKPGGSLDLDFNNLTNAYLFGERMMDIKYKNAVLDQLIAVVEDTGKFLDAEGMNKFYEGTLPGSPARRLIVDFCADQAEAAPSWMTNIPDFEPELLVDVLQGMLRARPPPIRQAWKRDNQTYHEKEA